MKNILSAAILASLISLPVLAGSHSSDVRLGIALGFTGPAESLAASMAAGAELAIDEVSRSGLLLGGSKVTSARADSTCVDAAAAAAAAERLIASEKVDAIVGALCSGATISILQNVSMPNGVVLFSPSATSPALSTLEDNGYFFRSSPSDARQGQVIAEMLVEKGYKSIAMTYTNNDYGKGLADAFQAAYEANGGSVTINAAHEEGKADYSSEVGALASAGGQALVVAGYIDGAGKNVTQGAIDTGAFDMFLFPDGMIGDNLENFGTDIDGSLGTVPGLDPTNPAASAMAKIGEANGFAGGDAFVGESYDAAALMLLAMASAKSSDPQVYKDHIMKVANGTGEKIYPGELAKGIKLASYGVAIDYVGASSVSLIGPGEAAGNFREIQIQNGKMVDVNYR